MNMEAESSMGTPAANPSSSMMEPVATHHGVNRAVHQVRVGRSSIRGKTHTELRRLPFHSLACHRFRRGCRRKCHLRLGLSEGLQALPHLQEAWPWMGMEGCQTCHRYSPEGS